MSTTAARRDALERLPIADALTAAAEVGAEIVALFRKARVDPDRRFQHISDARALAKIGLFLTSYVQMFEGAT
jgi:hypothetical protein